MAATPAVVPTARTSFWARVIELGQGSAGPGMNANTRNVAITIRLLRTGANIGAANRRWVFRSPVATAPIPYSAICGMKNRRKNAASSCTAARSGPGTRNV